MKSSRRRGVCWWNHQRVVYRKACALIVNIWHGSWRRSLIFLFSHLEDLSFPKTKFIISRSIEVVFSLRFHGLKRRNTVSSNVFKLSHTKRKSRKTPREGFAHPLLQETFFSLQLSPAPVLKLKSEESSNHCLNKCRSSASEYRISLKKTRKFNNRISAKSELH